MEKKVVLLLVVAFALVVVLGFIAIQNGVTGSVVTGSVVTDSFQINDSQLNETEVMNDTSNSGQG